MADPAALLIMASVLTLSHDPPVKPTEQQQTAGKTAQMRFPGNALDLVADTDSDVPQDQVEHHALQRELCLLYTSPSPRDGLLSRMPSSA